MSASLLDGDAAEHLVIGGGISGIACAAVLRDAGRPVVVRDRGHRLGGRMAVRTVEGIAGPGGEMQISPEDRCPVCAMLPSRYPRFAAAIVLSDGRTYYFCSPGCMVNAWLHPDIFLGTTATTLEHPVAR